MTSEIDTSHFFRVCTAPMAILSSDGVVNALNGGFRELLDDPSSAKGMPFVRLLRGGDVQRVTKVFAELGREGTTFDAVVQRGQSGKTRAARFHASRDEAGNVLLVGTLKDEAHDDEALRLALLDKMVESAPVLLWEIDSSGNYTISEGRALEAFGARPGEWVGRNAIDTWRGTPVQDNLVRALAGEEFFERVHLPEASFDTWHVPIKDRSGRPNGMLGFAIDVSKQVAIQKELSAKLAAVEQHNATLKILSVALETAPLILWGIDKNGVGTHSSGKALERLGMKPGESVGMNLLEYYKDSPEALAPIMKALNGEEVRTSAALGKTHLETWYMPVHTHDGHIDGCIGLSIDITDRVRTELELREKLELIEAQSATIRALATPIIQVWDGILCLPVIGTVDSARTADMMESLLSALVRERARFAIIDLTGVEVVDTSTADHLLQLFRAARVLGVHGVLCGIRPAVAQTVVTLGADLGSVRTMRSLRDALKWCFQSMQTADRA